MKGTWLILLLLISSCTLIEAQNTVEKKAPDYSLELKRLYNECKYKDALLLYSHYKGERTAEECLYIGLSCFSLSLYNQSVEYLDSAYHKKPDDIGYEYQLAKTYSFMGQTQNAESHYLNILKKDSTYIPALFDAGVICFSKRNYVSAADKFKRIIKINPANFLAFFNLANVYNNFDSDKYSDSINICLTAASDLNPDYMPAVELLAQKYMEAKKYDQARLLYNNAISKNPAKADYYYAYGLSYQYEKEYKKAIPYIRQAIEISSKDNYWEKLGFGYYNLNNYDSAKICYKQAIAIEPMTSSYHVDLGYIYARLDSTEQAVKSIRIGILLLQPQSIAKLYSEIGNLFYKKMDYSQARKEYDISLAINPYGIDPMFFGAICDEELKNYSKALAGYKQAKNLLEKIYENEEDLKQDEKYKSVNVLIAELSKRLRRGKK